MIIRKIILNNIRSYENQEVNFPEGSTLLSGDIGSGKTSILLGIEFALFGLQPGQRGTSLLRNGKNEGGVMIKFEIENNLIVVERTLKRGKTVSQDYCAITIDGQKRELSVTELKDKILEILSYPKEFSKKQNLLYKFTVYTPQEEMKQIIMEDPEVRLNTLRHVFGIDKYKKIIENASLFASKLREEKRMLEGVIENLEQDKSNLVSKEREVESDVESFAILEKELILKESERKLVQEEKESIEKKIEERNTLKQEVEKAKITVLHKNESLASNRKIVEQLGTQIEEFSKIEFDENEILKLESLAKSIQKEREKLGEENVQIASKISSLNIKIRDKENLKTKISGLELCPTCLQDVNYVHKSNIINSFDSDISETKKDLETLEFERKKVLDFLSEINEKLSSTEKKIQEQKILKLRTIEIEEKRKRLEDLTKSNESLKNDIILLDSHTKRLSDSIFALNKFENIFEENKMKLDKALNAERMVEIKVAELKREIELLSRQIEEMKERIQKVEEAKEKLGNIINLESWLSKNFIPLVSLVERNVMIKLKTEFSNLFSKWFSMLVPENFEARFDENFTPIIEFQDYEIDYSYLSGGERTAIALSYRLALTQVVNSLLGRIKTKDIVILDEPTDGFSDVQLDKIRDVLKQLNSRQLIIVSHEQKIEGFVENVIRFSKEHGTSRIVSESFV